MGIQMSYMTQMEIGESIKNGMGVIVPTGATEAHGPHMPTHTDTHQSEYIAIKLAERIKLKNQMSITVKYFKLNFENLNVLLGQ